ncbi:protein TRC8 homolog [Rhopalosiphum maidis]|uniref:protein TRC8 homolog n=1 Tax=Rhopalosiphum maidis TaxID=43146 RepID=UPI000EFF8EF1|nr:protein TRC8 homolog [Rhopalosiphum maidis]
MRLCDFLRVPALFIMDQIFKISFGFENLDGIIINLHNTSKNGDFTQYYKLMFLFFTKIIVSCLIFGLSLCLLALPTRYLYLVYLHSVSVCVVLLSYWANTETLNVLSEKYENFITIMINGAVTWDVDIIIHHFKQLQIVNVLYLLFFNVILQIFLSQVFDFLQVCTTNHTNHKVFNLGFIMPTIIALIPGSHAFLNTVSVLLTLLPLFIMLKTLLLNIFTIIDLFCHGYNHIRLTINTYEINNLIIIEWSRLKIPSVLRIFWAMRVLEQMAYLLTQKEIKNETLFKVVKYLLIKGCNTFTAVLGMTSFVSYFFYYLGAFIRWILLTEDVEQINIENVLAVLFYLLAIQTGLTVTEPEERFVQLYRNFCLTCGILLIYVHSLVNPLLLSLSISQNSSLNRHLRPLLVCGFLLVLSYNILIYLWSYNLLNNWLLAFSSLNIQIIIKVLVTLAIYSLNIINEYYRLFDEKLDDYVFYIKSFGSVVNFCFGVCIFLNGVYNTAFVSDSVIHTPLMCLDAYLIIWCGIRDGWKIFIRRRIAMLKIESLADATNEQSSEINDNCPICYQKMVSAKITNCNHFYHGTCLRKWLYLQDYCPMCHTVVS